MMIQRNFETTDHYANGVCVGLIVLQTDEVMEEELRNWLPTQTRLFHTRIASGADVTTETLLAMRDKIPEVTAMLPPSAPISVVAYGCTSGTTLIGEDTVRELIQQVLPNALVTNPLTAVKAKLADLDAKKIGILTPYLPEVTNEMTAHLQSHGFNIVSAASFYEKQEATVCRIDEQSISAALKEIAAQEKCDALFASCTNLRTYHFIDRISHDLGIPVISSNSALAWHIGQLSGNTSNN